MLTSEGFGINKVAVHRTQWTFQAVAPMGPMRPLFFY